MNRVKQFTIPASLPLLVMHAAVITTLVLSMVMTLPTIG